LIYKETEPDKISLLLFSILGTNNGNESSSYAYDQDLNDWLLSSEKQKGTGLKTSSFQIIISGSKAKTAFVSLGKNKATRKRN